MKLKILQNIMFCIEYFIFKPNHQNGTVSDSKIRLNRGFVQEMTGGDM